MPLSANTTEQSSIFFRVRNEKWKRVTFAGFRTTPWVTRANVSYLYMCMWGCVCILGVTWMNGRKLISLQKWTNSNQIRRINETKNLTGEAKDKTVPQIEQLKETAKNAELKQQIKWDGHLIRARVAQFAKCCLQKGGGGGWGGERVKVKTKTKASTDLGGIKGTNSTW